MGTVRSLEATARRRQALEQATEMIKKAKDVDLSRRGLLRSGEREAHRSTWKAKMTTTLRTIHGLAWLGKYDEGEIELLNFENEVKQEMHWMLKEKHRAETRELLRQIANHLDPRSLSKKADRP